MMRLKTNDGDNECKVSKQKSKPLSPLLSTNLLTPSDENLSEKQSHNTSDLLIVLPSNSFLANNGNILSKTNGETNSKETVKSCPFFDAHYWR